jgi:hypothetical protein
MTWSVKAVSSYRAQGQAVSDWVGWVMPAPTPGLSRRRGRILDGAAELMPVSSSQETVVYPAHRMLKIIKVSVFVVHPERQDAVFIKLGLAELRLTAARLHRPGVPWLVDQPR